MVNDEWNEMKPVLSQIISQQQFSHITNDRRLNKKGQYIQIRLKQAVLPAQTINIDHTPEFSPIIDLLNSAGKSYLGTHSKEAVQWQWYRYQKAT